MIAEEQTCPAAPSDTSAWEESITDSPWNAKSFIAASAATIGGLASWIVNFSSPTVAQLGGSYLGGFILGWAFRRLLRAAAMMAALTIACIAVLKSTGWLNLDWPSIETQVSQGIRWLHGEAEGLKNLLTGFFPSAGAAGAGTFFGFRKK
ncbi:FUN14 domain-containing protein [Petrachloros mirabilis]